MKGYNIHFKKLKKNAIFANMTSISREQLDFEVENKESYFNKGKDDGKVFGRYRSADTKKILRLV